MLLYVMVPGVCNLYTLMILTALYLNLVTFSCAGEAQTKFAFTAMEWKRLQFLAFLFVPLKHPLYYLDLQDILSTHITKYFSRSSVDSLIMFGNVVGLDAGVVARTLYIPL